MKTAAAVRMWTIYQSPSDYPGQFVAREFSVTSKGPVAAKDPLSVHERLEIVRLAIKWHCPGVTCVGRQPDDDPVIVETWI